jgi:hypothetical protein
MAKVAQVELEYYLPVATVLGQSVGSIYAFLGQEDPWPIINGVETPIQPTEDQFYLKKTFKNMFALKLLNTSNISPVIQRIDWANNTNYFAYSDVQNNYAKDENGLLLNNFYIKNRYDQVFKCLSNNQGSLSTVEPYFQPGSYGTNNIFQGIDMYKWKYMYTIDAGSKNNFMDSTWMPVPVGANTPQPYFTQAGYGDVEVINITNGGSGYDPVNNYIVVTVTGDGSGAVGVITPSQVVNGIITDVTVPQGGTGNNYTYANITINAYTSSNQINSAPITTQATAVAPVSPVGGHAYDCVSELGCNHLMFSVEFNGSENETIPTQGVVYRQVGLLVDPQQYGSSGAVLANGAIYNTSTQIQLPSGTGIYYSDQLVYQAKPSANGKSFPVDTTNNQTIMQTAGFFGTVLNFNTSSNIIQLINTTGTLTINQSLVGPNDSRVVFSVSNSNIIPFSGYITYIENRAGVQRSTDGIEQFKFVLGY